MLDCVVGVEPDDLAAAGYGTEAVERIKALQKQYLDLREIIRKAAGETLDLKPFEADMRHLIDTYIEASAPRKISSALPICSSKPAFRR